MRSKNVKRGHGIYLLTIVLSLFCIMTSEVIAESVSFRDATVLTKAHFAYSIEEVYFEKPINISIGNSVAPYVEAIKVVIKGNGFIPKATGPVIWLNSISTLRTVVAEDGTYVEGYFYQPLRNLDESAEKMGRWELIYQSHEGTPEVYRISPTGDVKDIDSRPTIKKLSPQERKKVDAIKREFKIE